MSHYAIFTALLIILWNEMLDERVKDIKVLKKDHPMHSASPVLISSGSTANAHNSDSMVR